MMTLTNKNHNEIISKSSKVTMDGEGLPRNGHLRSTHVFRMLNFELYAKPNKMVMGVGLACLTSAIAYLVYMRIKYNNTGNYYSLQSDDGNSNGGVTMKKVSKWDS